jgi:hypothetical protein
MSTVMRNLVDAEASTRWTHRYSRRWAELDGLGLFGPSLFLLLVLFVLPTFGVFAIAMTNWQFGSKSLSFVGLDNFVALYTDRTFRASLCNAVFYVVIVVPTSVVLGLLIALVIESGNGFEPSTELSIFCLSWRPCRRWLLLGKRFFTRPSVLSIRPSCPSGCRPQIGCAILPRQNAV